MLLENLCLKAYLAESRMHCDERITKTLSKMMLYKTILSFYYCVQLLLINMRKLNLFLESYVCDICCT